MRNTKKTGSRSNNKPQAAKRDKYSIVLGATEEVTNPAAVTEAIVTHETSQDGQATPTAPGAQDATIAPSRLDVDTTFDFEAKERAAESEPTIAPPLSASLPEAQGPGTSEKPDENWPLEKLASYAINADQRASRFSYLESAERFRLGMALHLAHKKIGWGGWKAWLDETFSFTRITAWRAEQLYLRATEKYGDRAEEACGNQGINDLYVNLTIKKKDKWLVNEKDLEEAPGQVKDQGAQQPLAKQGQTNKPHSTNGEGEAGPAVPPPGDDEQTADPEQGDEAGEEDTSMSKFPDDPRGQAEGAWKQQYATNSLIFMAADCLQDALARFDTTMPKEKKAIQVARVALEHLKGKTNSLIEKCKAMQEAIR